MTGESLVNGERVRPAASAAAARMAAAFRRRPPPRHPVVLLAIFLVGVIFVFDGPSVSVDIVASSSLTLTAPLRPLVLSSRQLVVACRLCRHIVLRCRLVLSSRRLVDACRVASVALSCCATLSSSRRASWLLRVARLCRPIWLHRPLVLTSCRLIVACRVASVAISCCAALSSSCRSRRLCRHIMLRRLLRAGWLLRVTFRPIVLRCPLILSSHGWLLLVASPLSVAVLSCVTLSCSCHTG